MNPNMGEPAQARPGSWHGSPTPQIVGQSGSRLGSPNGRDPCSRKERSIRRALKSEMIDVITLRQLAIGRGGLLKDELRIEAWPCLLGVDVRDIDEKPDEETLRGHRDYQQVVLDVNRSLKRFPPGMEESIRLSKQDQLVDTIMRVLVAVPELHYYQGYHDIVVTILLVAGEDLTYALMKELSTNHLRCFMDQNMDRTKHILNYLYPIMGRACPELREFMEKSEVGTIFSLSWLITWFGHVLNDFKHIVRLYDYFIASHPLMPIYLAAAVVLYRKKEVLATECEMCMVHSLLSKIPDNLPFEELASNAGDLFIQFPPDKLEIEAQVIAQKNKCLQEEMEREARAMKEASRLACQRPQPRSYLPVLPFTQSSLLVKLTLLTASVTVAALAVYSPDAMWKWFSHR